MRRQVHARGGGACDDRCMQRGAHLKDVLNEEVVEPLVGEVDAKLREPVHMRARTDEAETETERGACAWWSRAFPCRLGRQADEAERMDMVESCVPMQAWTAGG